MLSINTSIHTILVRRVRNDSCGALEGQYSSGHRGNSPYNLGASAVNITLFIGCPSENAIGFHRVSISCLGLDVNVPVYYAEKGAEGGSKCKRNVTMPVSRKAFDEFVNSGYNNATLESGLQYPFEVDYFANLKECWACQKSGGVCGSSIPAEPESDKLVCYHRGKRQHLGVLLGLGITGSVVLMVALVAFCYCKKLKFFCSNFISRSLSIDNTTSDIEIGSLCFDVPLFSYKDLEEATNNFNDSRELGSGGFGRVYYGKLKDGREVAVKQLYEKNYRRVVQFMNEVQILTRLRHQNLVSLYGCTSPHCRELLLVYEYICNGTVSDHLYGTKSNSSFLSWPTRMRIAIETASALSYLHASDIIHRDVKTNNILLDGNFSVKVADFGLSRLFPSDVTHVSTAPQGTPGYLDPEYHQCYQLTVKSDVYSFGVVLIELISSLPAVDMHRQKHEINLSNYAMNRIKHCAFEELVDPRLGFGSNLRVRRMTILAAELAFRCLQHDKDFRPAMDEVLEVLKKIESADCSEQLGAEENEVRDHTKRVLPSTIEDEHDDGARLLMSSMHLHDHRQEIHPSSPNSVIDRWRSRSTISSNTSRQEGSNVFYSMSN